MRPACRCPVDSSQFKPLAVQHWLLTTALAIGSASHVLNSTGCRARSSRSPAPRSSVPSRHSRPGRPSFTPKYRGRHGEFHLITYETTSLTSAPSPQVPEPRRESRQKQAKERRSDILGPGRHMCRGSSLPCHRIGQPDACVPCFQYLIADGRARARSDSSPCTSRAIWLHLEPCFRGARILREFPPACAPTLLAFA